ncbi:nuclear transport factor 2 family protein [Streptomyces sp. NBC_01622]|uniref:nuclear transport factor 2 family protein n=1 Tax=Streptomyces sp. NBC_01622 TaxID=2975903 RepID=UPI0038665782|nr:nuclear transport factor 2 family protein [Streptomyces sp. NBC_01622]
MTVTSRSTLAATFVAAALTAAMALPASAATSPATTVRHTGHPVASRDGENERLQYQKSVAVGVLKGLFERGDTKIVDRYVRPDYIQHNPTLPDGAEAFKNLGVSLHRQYPALKFGIKQVISEGDLVIVHSHVQLTPDDRGGSYYDIYRFQGGKLAEHWDVIQDVPATSVNGHDMFSTISRPPIHQTGPRWLTAANKKLVTAFVNDVPVHKDLSAIDRYVAPDYLQHNPTIPDGIAGVKAGMAAYFEHYPQMTFTPKRIIAEGDLVAVHSHFVAAPGERGQAVVDLFRVQNGKIVEHWDSLQDVPETSANDNTMF